MSSTPEALEAMRRQISLGMLDMAGLLAPIYDTADGMKADLAKRGWSEALAEQIAGSWLAATLASIASGGRRG
ncbi:hypothetical protein ABT264_19435 [Streptomyces virginiae]|uniref:hypothetical protein n=1 Tax=Streptomyces virginiae TaxID=1961 RepID=UPI00332816A2